MVNIKDEKLIGLDTSLPIWEHFFTVSPLVVIGSKEGDNYDLAPKHMAFPMGYDNFFGFVCTPRHSTYHNVLKEGCFSVSYLIPDKVLLASLAASPRVESDNYSKTILEGLPTVRAEQIDALFIRDSYLFLECRLHKVIDDFGQNSLITGRIIGAYVRSEYLRESEKDEQEMIHAAPLLSYLAYGRFAEIRQSYAFPFPKDFKI